MKAFEIGSQPITMSVTAQAVWSEEKKRWEVDIIQSETNVCYPSERYTFTQSVHHVEVEDCDEFVIADALLHVNGIDVQSLYQASENPIVESES